jgi:adenine/guanine phosphoribosyltransferase-like PRPP-binding protein
MPQAERQANMNQAYDALMDLAGVVGVPPKALSLNGELGLAFGARGHGGKNPAAAHYEQDTTGEVTPNRVVINLTRKNGAGSLAHEWFHATDNYFARMQGQKAGFMTEKVTPDERVRLEMKDAFKALTKAINLTSIKERSKTLDKLRTKDYWSTGLEMAARSFESYVIAKLQDQNASNDYLANITSEAAWSKENGYPYPTAGEIPAIRAAFDNFFQVVQTKETDKGVAMYSRAVGMRLPDVVIGNKLGTLLNHPDYAAAKAGDTDAAFRIAVELVDAAMVEAVKKATNGADMIVPVVSVEATGRNKIPQAVAEVLAKKLGTTAESQIVQIDSPKRTVMDGLSRMLNTPVFDGPVQKGAAYIMVDDTVTQGGTFAALASHIKDNGGEVAGAVVLTGKQYSAKLELNPELLNQVREKFQSVEPDFKAATGYGFDALTESEARYLAKHDHAQSVRDRIIAAGSTASLRENAGNARKNVSGLPLAQVKSITDSIKSKWANAPEIVIAANMDDKAIPQAVRDHNDGQLSQGAQGSPEGFLYGGKVYLVADQLATPTDVMRVLFHESLGHVGLRGTFGDSLTPILQQVAMFRQAETIAKAREYGLLPEGLPADAKPSEILKAMSEENRLTAAEEVLAVMAQDKPEMGFVKRTIAAIRTWLRKHGVNLKLTDNDIIANYILPARAWVQSGKGSVAGETAFSRQSQTDTPAFKAWFGDSKVVDSDGKPLVVYHGTDEKFNIFNTSESGTYGAGIYFGDSSQASGYGNNKIAAYISIKKPWLVDAVYESPLAYELDSDSPVLDTLDALPQGRNIIEDMLANKRLVQFGHFDSQLQSYLRGLGYDGIIARYDNDTKEYVVFEPTQIKSATGNNGNFNPANPDIRFSRSTDKIGETLKAVTVTDIKAKAGNKLADYRNLGLQFLGGRQLADLYGKDIPQIDGYTKMVQQMSADANEVGAQADSIVTGWSKLTDERQLAELMHDATLLQIDPAKDYVEGDNRLQWGKLNAQP